MDHNALITATLVALMMLAALTAITAICAAIYLLSGNYYFPISIIVLVLGIFIFVYKKVEK